MSRALGFFFVILAGIGFGFLGIFSRLAFQAGLTVGELLTWRFVTASALLWLGLLVIRPKLVRAPLKQILISLALGIFGYVVFSTLYFKSIEGISVPLAAMLLFTFPIYVNLGSHFIFKERMTPTQIVSLALACTGLGILLWGPVIVQSKLAILYGLGSGLTYAIYVLVSGRVQQNIHPLSSSLYVITGAAVTLLAIHQPSYSHWKEFNSTQLTCILGLAIVSTIGPLTFFLAGLQRLPSGQASILGMIEPVVAAFAAGWILGENLTPSQLIGSGVILTSLVVSALERSKSQIKPEVAPGLWE